MTKKFMNPNGKILVPVNLDASSGPLLKAAGQIAKRTGLGLIVTHVSEYWVGRSWPTEMMLGGPMGGLVTTVETEAMDVAKEQLQKLIKNHLPGLEVQSQVLLGYPAEAIRAHALTSGAELIIVGGAAEDYKYVPRGLSTVLALMADAPCPVLVLPKGATGHWDQKSLKAVLADDLKPESDTGVFVAYEWATALGSTELFHVHANQMTKESLKEALVSAAAAAHTPEGAMDAESVWTAAMRSIEEKLKTRAPGRRHLLEARGGKVDVKLLQGDPVDAVLKFADDHKVDMLLFGRHRTWRRKPFAIGQLPFHAMLKSRRPVLITEHVH